MDSDTGADIAARIGHAFHAREPLCVRGGGSKAFLGRPVDAGVLALGGHCGVIAYEPAELVLTARAGTPLATIESLLAAHGQMLAFEPPHWGEGATLGGTIACAVSGPRRPCAGSARDFVLGVRCVNGRGEVLRFGGQVMKNVAGFDVSRLQCGAQGTLGVLLDVSLKVLPLPASQRTLVQKCTAAAALATMNRLAAQPLPLTGAVHDGASLYLRFEGAAVSVAQAITSVGGDELADAASFWHAWREHELPFFRMPGPLWRLSVPPAAPLGDVPGAQCLDWGGAQRWLRSDAAPAQVQAAVAALGGHATRLHAADGILPPPLPPALQALQQRIRRAFDPAGILNPGRLGAES